MILKSGFVKVLPAQATVTDPAQTRGGRPSETHPRSRPGGKKASSAGDPKSVRRGGFIPTRSRTPHWHGPSNVKWKSMAASLRQRTAIHEAAHAVCALVFGIPVISVHRRRPTAPASRAVPRDGPGTKFLLAVPGGALLPSWASAQEPGRVYRMAVISSSEATVEVIRQLAAARACPARLRCGPQPDSDNVRGPAGAHAGAGARGDRHQARCRRCRSKCGYPGGQGHPRPCRL